MDQRMTRWGAALVAAAAAGCGTELEDTWNTGRVLEPGLESIEPSIRRPGEAPTVALRADVDRPLDRSGLDAADLVDRDPILGVEAPSPSEPAKLIRKEDAIPDHYLVVFHDREAHRAGALARELASRLPLELRFVYETAVPGFAAVMPRAVMEEIRAHPAVRYVEEDAPVHAIAVQSNATWGIDRVDSPTGTDGQYEYNFDGSGVHAYIIDTGIRQAHQEFTGRIGAGYDSVDNDTNPEDCDGHGTHVAGTVGGTVYGVAKDVTLHGVRVLNCSGSGTISGVVAGVDWVAANAISPAVGNMSLGGGASTTLDNAVSGAVAADVVMVVAAGNSNTDACTQSPAREADAVTVGSTTNSDQRSSFSNYGSCLDIFAPGSSITSAWFTSNSATNTISGTSMAAPHVAGIAALYREENPSANAAATVTGILNNATTGVVGNAGPNSPNLFAFSLFGGSAPPPPPPPPPSAPCSGPSCEAYTGSLSGTGAWAAQPSGNYFFSSSGTHYGWLEGPTSADFDLRLMRWSWFGWQAVASSLSPSSSESIVYSGGSGYYYWRIESYSGSGNYQFWMIRP